ncbi:helix-turn-helix domain-containing protein [Nocardioides sp.]|nr:helix-turn-helix domain-containing protein [Nocardioides sp.]THJ13732.1 helix-turn-helix domain-containing protein [Nocardioides sp.]
MKRLHNQATITIPEAAELLGVERKTAYNAARRGELPTITLGRRRLVPTQALLDLLARPR